MRSDPLSPASRGTTLAFAAVVEAGTGLALLIDPALVATLIWGAELAVMAPVLARCFGIALLALAIACWPGQRGRGAGTSPLRAMLVYNALLALYLAYLGAVQHLSGLLLWPAVVLHTALALVLAWPGRRAVVPAR